MGTKRKHQLLDQMENSEKLTEEQFSALKKLAKDRAADIRYRVAEQLCMADPAEAEEILILLLGDKDDMVRVSASDSLSACGSQGAMALLKQHAVSDRCFMVRGYAAYSATDIALRLDMADAEFAAFLKSALDVEADDWVQAFLCAALYRLNRDEYLPRLLGALDNDNDQVRCAAVNLLSYTVKEKDKSTIREALKSRREKEDPEAVSVISTIDQCLQEIEGAQQ